MIANFQFETRHLPLQHNSRFTDVEFVRFFLPLPPNTIVLSDSINFYLRDCASVDFSCVPTRESISIGPSLSRAHLRHPPVYIPLVLPFFPLYLFPSHIFFSILLSSLPHPFVVFPSSPVSSSFFLAVDFRERNGGGVKRTQIAAVRTYVCVSRLGHGSLYQRVRFRVSPRVPGKPRTCHPSAETGRRRRSSAVSPLSLRPLLASSHAGFFISPPLSLLTIPFSRSGAPCAGILINYNVTKYIC